MKKQDTHYISNQSMNIIESIVIKPKHDKITLDQLNNLHSLIESAPPGYCKTLLHKKNRWHKAVMNCIELPRIQPSNSLISQIKHTIPNALLLVTYRCAADPKKLTEDLDSLTLMRDLDQLFETAKKNLAREE